MGITEQFDHHEKKQNKEHFADLIQIALADGIIDVSEQNMLRRMGRNLSLTDPEIDELIATAVKTAHHPPYEYSKRFEQVYNIMKMILADGVVEKNEMAMANRLCTKLGFSEPEIPGLLIFLLEGIRAGKDADDLFEEYRKKNKP